MIGAVAGDIIRSVYEWNRIKTKDFELFSPGCSFTDDSVLSIALADAILDEILLSPLSTCGVRRLFSPVGAFRRQPALQ